MPQFPTPSEPSGIYLACPVVPLYLNEMVDEEFVFVCPECDETLEVNASMRDVLIEKGCVVCGASVSADSFSE